MVLTALANTDQDSGVNMVLKNQALELLVGLQREQVLKDPARTWS